MLRFQRMPPRNSCISPSHSVAETADTERKGGRHFRIFLVPGAVLCLLITGCRGMEYSPYNNDGYYGSYGPESEAGAYYDLKAYREDKEKEKD